MTALAHDTLPGWDSLPAHVPGTMRPALRLVPTGRAARGSRPTSPLRISRFGRLVLTGAVVVIASVLAITLFGAGSASAGIDHTVTVMSGQTLSGIADTEMPSLPIAEGVAQIQLANHLDTSQIHAGQQLAIPSIG